MKKINSYNEADYSYIRDTYEPSEEEFELWLEEVRGLPHDRATEIAEEAFDALESAYNYAFSRTGCLNIEVAQYLVEDKGVPEFLANLLVEKLLD